MACRAARSYRRDCTSASIRAWRKNHLDSVFELVAMSAIRGCGEHRPFKVKQVVGRVD
jgi:hypothetical protein